MPIRARAYVIFFVLLLIAAIFFHYEKRYLNPYIAPQPTVSKPATDNDSLSIHKTVPQADITDYNIPYEGSQRVTYLLPKLPKGDEMITHIGYTLAYNEENEEADWVAYELKGSEVHIQRKRTENFKPDPSVTTQSAIPADYFHSGYDRGHLAPAADMKESDQTMRESFYMSNMTPQEPDFNRGIWEDLEEQVRNWAVSDQDIYVVTGPVFEQPISQRLYIGADKVAVPDAFYKIVLDLRKNNLKAISFLIPNEGNMQTYWQYTTSIDNIEKITGLDFFPSLPDTIETVLEQNDNPTAWQ